MTTHPRGRRRATGLTATRATRTAITGLLLIGGVAACGSPRSSTQPPLGYRSLPTFLPTTASPVDQIVTASAAHPQLAAQGVGVKVDLPSGAVLATITGPHVPPFVAPPPPQVTATFEISLARAAGSVPVRLSDFTITDQLDRTYRPSLVTHEAPPPKTVAPGRSVTFRVTAVMPTGEGHITWSPSGKTAVAWDFIVEND